MLRSLSLSFISSGCQKKSAECQFTYSDFQNVDRSDYRHLFGANLTYQFTDRVFGSASSTFADNDSSADFASFQAFSLSLGVTVQF